MLTSSFTVNQQRTGSTHQPPLWRAKTLSTLHMLCLTSSSKPRTARMCSITSLSSVSNWTSILRISGGSTPSWRKNWTTGRPKPCGQSWTKGHLTQITSKEKPAPKTRYQQPVILYPFLCFFVDYLAFGWVDSVVLVPKWWMFFSRQGCIKTLEKQSHHKVDLFSSLC